LTVDSDTVVEPDGVRWILTPFLDDRYALLCDHERAGQSRFGLVYCCAGSFSAYPLGDLDEDWSGDVGQRFRGKSCTYGDHLQVTHLVLKRGAGRSTNRRRRCST
jgi:hypothetical protein